jgi:hypothetical protein
MWPAINALDHRNQDAQRTRVLLQRHHLMTAVYVIMSLCVVLLAFVACRLTTGTDHLDNIARTTRVIVINQQHIRERLNKMPTLDDLNTSVAAAKAAVDAAAQRVIDAQGNGIPQETIDNVNAIKTDADAISPA